MKNRWIAFMLITVVLASFLVELPTLRVSAGPVQIPEQSPILDNYIDIWHDDVDNLYPAVAYSSLHDEYLVAFYNNRGSTRDIYAQRVGGDGSLKTWFAVAYGADQVNWLPDIAYSPVQDEYLIVYTHADPGPSSTFDIWARRVKWNGSDLGLPEYAPFPVVLEVDMQWDAQVAYNDQRDEYLVVYTNEWTGGTKDIAAQRVRASDGALLSWRNLASVASQWRIDPHVAYNSTRDEYLVAYSYWSSPSSKSNIRGKITSYNMDTLSSEIYICDEPGDQLDVAVAAGPDEYLVVWSDEENSALNDYDILGRRISGAGALLGIGGFPIAGIGDTKLYEKPSVDYSSVYGYLVAWDHDIDPSSVFDYDVSGSYVFPGQNQSSGDIFDIDSSGNWQISPDLACNDRGDCLAVYMDNWPVGPTGDYDILGRIVKAYRLHMPLVIK